MSTIPRFLFRAADAIGPVASVSADELAALVDSVVVTVEVTGGGDPGCCDGALLAVNLLARLYPHVSIEAPDPTPLRSLAVRINPGIDLNAGPDGPRRQVRLVLGPGPSGSLSANVEVVHVSAHGWNVSIDGFELPEHDTAEPASTQAWLAAACVGVGEVFRAVFANQLGSGGRWSAQPGGFNLVTTQPVTTGLPLLAPWSRAELVLVGAGAVGQAALLTLRTASSPVTVYVVDHETIDLSNLQRYVLTADDDVGKPKVGLAVHAMTGSAVTVIPHASKWGSDGTAALAALPVLVALDTAADRIGVAAAVPARAYNAWTQPQDLGWSWHENFGDEPCLACLYYPQRSRPSEHELIAAVLGQHPVRVLGYLTDRIPVGLPLIRVLELAGIALPPDAHVWLQRSLMDDLVATGRVSEDERERFTDRTLANLYREGACGSGLLQLGPPAQEREAVVPLAHQSALAGVMLATTALIATDLALAGARPAANEARFDVLRGFPQILARPRVQTAYCLCTDPDYLASAKARKVAGPGGCGPAQ